jgi:acid phosphatase class B
MHRLRTTVASVLAAAVVAVATPATASVSPPVAPLDVPGQPTVVYGVHDPLRPLAGQKGHAAGPGMAQQIRAFRASGAYARQQREVAFVASRYQARWIADHCAGVAGRAADRCPDGRQPAAVFDIDDTLVSWYGLYSSTGFRRTKALVRRAVEGCDTPRIAPVVQFYRDTRARGLAVFLITGRNESVREATVACLARRHIAGYAGLVMRTNDQEDLTATAFKSSARAVIEADGYRIVTVIGDQVSDSAGGHASRGFLLPNPMYVIP